MQEFFERLEECDLGIENIDDLKALAKSRPDEIIGLVDNFVERPFVLTKIGSVAELGVKANICHYFTNNRKARDEMAVLHPEHIGSDTEDGVLYADGFDSAIMGWSWRGEYPVIVYNQALCLVHLMKDMDYEDSCEHFQYNIIGGYHGKYTPLFVDGVNDEEILSEYLLELQDPKFVAVMAGVVDEKVSRVYLGKNNALPWSFIKEDMQNFKSLTTLRGGKFGHVSISDVAVVVMGYNTWVSIGSKPLPGRVNIIVSSRELADVNLNDDVRHALDLTGALNISRGLGQPRPFLIGGVKTYLEAYAGGMVEQTLFTQVVGDNIITIEEGSPDIYAFLDYGLFTKVACLNVATEETVSGVTLHHKIYS